MKLFLFLFVISTLDSTRAFSTCERLQRAPHSSFIFSGEKDNLSSDDCGELTDSTSSQFPWDVVITSEREYCMAAGILVSPRAVLFDLRACNFGNDVQVMNESIKLVLSGFASRSTSPFVKPTRIYISDDKLLGLLIVETPLSNATVPKRPICLYSFGTEDDQNAEFLATSTSKDRKTVQMKLSSSLNCHSLAKTTADCDALNSNSHVCLKLNDKGFQSLKSGFITRKVGNRYFLRSKLDQIPSLRHNDQNLISALDLIPYFDWIGNKAPDLRILSEQLTIIPPRVYRNGAESYNSCGRAPTPQIISQQAPNRKKRTEINPFLIKGDEAEVGAHPWHALLNFHFYNHELTQTQTQCGGSLLSARAIITAAHCLVSGESVLDPDEITVVLGAHSRTNNAEANRQTAQPSSVLIHPGYNVSSGRNFDNDLALLIFKEPFNVTNSGVKPICLWNKDSSLDQIVNISSLYTKLVGWGLDEYQTQPDILHESIMPIVSYEKCFQLDPKFYKKHLKPGVNFCAGDVIKESIACQGDSGGGLMVFEPKRRRWFLRGVVSFGKVRNTTDDQYVCDSTRYPLFADVAFYLPWIVANVPDIS